MLSEGAIANTRAISANIAKMCAQPELPPRQKVSFAQTIGAGHQAVPQGIAALFGRAVVPVHHSPTARQYADIILGAGHEAARIIAELK